MPWSLEGENIQNSDKYAMNETSLMIRNIDYSDNGTYTCNDGKLYFLRVIAGTEIISLHIVFIFAVR